eukprot:5793276-Prymnesium_polylepis.2
MTDGPWSQCRETLMFLDNKKVRRPSLLEATPQSTQRYTPRRWRSLLHAESAAQSPAMPRRLIMRRS